MGVSTYQTPLSNSKSHTVPHWLPPGGTLTIGCRIVALTNAQLSPQYPPKKHSSLSTTSPPSTFLSLLSDQSAQPINYPGDKLSFHSPLLGEIRTLQGRLTNAIYEIHSQEHWLQLTPTGQARFLSCGGIGNGLCWRAPTKQTRLHLDDWEFQTCCAIRLGHPITAPAKCCNKSLNGSQCPQDNTLFHPLSCKIGGGVSFLHTALCTQLTKILKEAGLRAHREVPIPEFATTTIPLLITTMTISTLSNYKTRRTPSWTF